MNLSNFSQIRHNGKDIALAKLNGDIVYRRESGGDTPVVPDDRPLKMTYTIVDPTQLHTFNSDFAYELESTNNGDGTYTVNLYSNDDFTSFTCNRNTLTVEYLAITNKVTDMDHMFSNCAKLTYVNTSNWDISSVTNMNNLFSYCSSLTSLDLSNWNTSNVTVMNYMFSFCTGLISLNLEGWDLVGTSTQVLIGSCSSLTDLNVKNWKCGDLLGCFIGCSSLKSIDITGWDTTNTKSMQQLFYNCSELTDIYGYLDIDTSNVTNMYGLFAYTKLDDRSVDYMKRWNTKKVTNMSTMFAGLRLSNIHINFDTSSVTNMSSMFEDTCHTSFGYNRAIIEFDTSNVTTMSGMFRNSTLSIEFNAWPYGDCSSMFENFQGKLANMWSGNVTNARYMFANSNISDYEFTVFVNYLELGGCYDTSYMFYNCTNLAGISLEDEWTHTTYSLNECSYMFAGCTGLYEIRIPYMYTHNVWNYEGMFQDVSDSCSIYINRDNFTLSESDTWFNGYFQDY